MNVKLAYLLLLGAALIIGYLLGRVLAKRLGRGLSIIISLAGIMVWFLGRIAADDDHRFALLAIGGMFLWMAGMVGSMRNRRTVKVSPVDLWALRKHR